MKIQTKYLGEIEISEDTIIAFEQGIPGFLDEKQYVLLNFPDNSFFQILQSVKTAEIAFIVTNPFLYYQDYAFDLEDSLMENLNIVEEKDVVVLSIVTIRNPFEKSTMNLKAPIIINPKQMRGKQQILNIEDYPIKAQVVSSLEKGVK